MHKMLMILILTSLIPSVPSFGQDEDWEVAKREQVQFENTLDSLFLGNNYQEIIKICVHPGEGINPACTYNLIGVYYFLGDSAKSWSLLNKEMADYKSDAYALDNMLARDYTAYKKFLQNSTAKDYILAQMDSFYRTAAVSDKANGLELLHLLVEDQWIRNTSNLYDHFEPERRHRLPSKMDSAQAIQAQRDHCTKVFNFYKKQNKVFSEAEVGRIYYLQMLLFFHEWDLERRKFYHELVKQGVKSGALNIENQANFEAGTEFILLGVDEFFKRRASLEESYKKKYSLRDNYRIRLF